LTDGYELLSPL